MACYYNIEDGFIELPSEKEMKHDNGEKTEAALAVLCEKEAMESEEDVSQKTVCKGIMLPFVSMTVASIVRDVSSIDTLTIEEERVIEPG